MKFTFLGSASVAAMCACAPATLTLAAPEEQVARVEEITVVARQRSENLQDVPISVSALSADDLQKRDIKLATELQNYIPNLTINGAFGSSNPQIFIRGVGNNDFNDNAGATVGVYLDGVVLNSPSGKLLQMFDLENVQVLRGPQGTLFGKNNTAGAILFETKKPGDTLDGYATVTYGNFGERGIEGGITIPLSDGFSIRLAATKRVSDGWGETNDLDGNRLEQIGGVDQDALRAILRWQGEKTDVTLNISRARTDDDRLPGRAIGASPTGTDNANFKNPNDDIRVNFSNFKEIEKSGTDGVLLNIKHSFSSFDLTSISGIWESKRFVTLDVDKSPNNLIHIIRNPNADQISQELRLSSNSDTDLFKWVIGANYFREILHVQNYWAFGTVDPTISQNYDDKAENTAMFAEGILELNDMFSLTLGGRYSIDNVKFTMNFLDFGIVNEKRSREDKNFSGRAILEQRLDEDLLLYYSVSRGYQGGNFNGGAFSVDEIGDGFDPEKLTAYEFGWKAMFADHRLKLNGSIFYYDYNKIQVFSLGATPTGGVAQFIKNANGGELYGLDLEAQASLTNQLKLGLGLGLLHSNYKDTTLAILGFAGQSFPADGNPFISAPKFDAKAFIDYDLPVDNYLLSFHVDANHTSARNFDITARDLVRGGKYSLVNAKVSIGPVDGKWNVSAWGKNLFNDTYKSFVADLSGSGGFFETFYGAPRQYGLQFGVKI